MGRVEIRDNNHISIQNRRKYEEEKGDEKMYKYFPYVNPSLEK